MSAAEDADILTSGKHRAMHVSADDLSGFDAVATIAHSEAGLLLPRDKAPMVMARIAKRMRRLGFDTLQSYSNFISSAEGVAERREMIFSLTTNVTSFMREGHHFEFLSSHVIPQLATRGQAGQRIRMWSAGCSSGQEPYTMAMAVLEKIPYVARIDLRILATDLDPHVLDEARKGMYTADAVGSLPKRWRQDFLEEAAPTNSSDIVYRVKDNVRRLISFRSLNLIGDWPMRGHFDAIFCRNVAIYFDGKTQSRLWGRFADALTDHGHLFLGHSERIDTPNSHRFRAVGTTIYQRAETSVRNPDRAS